MTARHKRPTFEDLLAAVESVTDQIKILVAAVDDLRCEVEWQARNVAVAQSTAVSSPTVVCSLNETVETTDQRATEDTTSRATDDAVLDGSLLTASGRLQACERLYSQGPRERWTDDWSERDDFELPDGKIISVDADMWSVVLDHRPAHIVGEGCCCEAGIGAPYLLAWQHGDEFLLRELSDEEAYRLQALCLAYQAEYIEQAAQRIPTEPMEPAAKQQGLF